MANKIPGISGIDTRNLTKIIRKFDSCNALISHDPEGDFNILVLDILGPSLADLFTFCERNWNMRTILWIASQMI